MVIRVDTSSDTRWVLVTIPSTDSPDLAQEESTVAIDRNALQQILEEDPRPPEYMLDLIARRTVKRMPTANGPDGLRHITSYNLSLVWPK